MAIRVQPLYEIPRAHACAWCVAVWQAEEALEACRAELSTLREDLASVDNIIVKAERPHKVHFLPYMITHSTHHFLPVPFPCDWLLEPLAHPFC